MPDGVSGADAAGPRSAPSNAEPAAYLEAGSEPEPGADAEPEPEPQPDVNAYSNTDA